MNEPEAASAPSSRVPFIVALAAMTGFVSTLVWAVTGGGYNWSTWVWLGLLLALAPLWWIARWRSSTRGEVRLLRVHGAVSLTAGLTCLVVWLSTGSQRSWVFWPLLGLVVLWGLHALVLRRDDLPFSRAARLNDRVETLSRTRREALDAQASELRRIERDLHDGAQARLVALSMQLGRAESRLEDRPDVATLVREARLEAGTAIAELRDLARGIAPPVLADRGLAAAVRSLAERTPVPVDVTAVALELRVAPAVENALYFVVAEALTNVAKHAPDAAARVRVGQDRIPDPGRVFVEIDDDGPGGADVDGRGLQGLRSRVEALDGTLMLSSPPGGPTRLSVEVPCAS